MLKLFHDQVHSSYDLNAFFGLFTNVLLNTIVLTGLCLYVVQIPSETVFGRVLPALGIALPFGNIIYAFMAYKLAKKEGRSDVTALPYGPSVPHMFIVVFVVMLPTVLLYKDWVLAWKLGLIWCVLIGLIVLLGVLIGPTIRKYTPRAAMLGSLAGVALTYIAMRPVFQIYEAAWIGIICFMIILLNWVGGVRLPFNIPGGLGVVIVGSFLAWGATFLGFSNIMDPGQVTASLSNFAFYFPSFSFDVLSVPSELVWPLLVSAIPLGILNFTEILNNVESANAAGDKYNLRFIMAADGIGAILGGFLGSPFPPAVYIGHPGWKAMGGRIGYSMVTGIVMAILCFFGLTSLLLSVIPLVAIIPILLFIGLVIGAQAFQVSPKRHAPAIILALIPNVAEWLKTQVDGALSAAAVNTVSIPDEIIAGMNSGGVLYNGIVSAGGGGILACMILAAIAVFIIERAFHWAAVYAVAGCVLSFFGFIHGTSLAFNASPAVSFGYALSAVVFILMAIKESKERSLSWAPVSEEEN